MQMSVTEFRKGLRDKTIVLPKKKGKQNNDFEHKLQCEVIDNFPLFCPGKIIFAIPNGGYRNILDARDLKKEGVLKGVSDLCIPEPHGGYHGIYAETKYGKNTTSDEQDWFLEEMSKRGYYTFVYYTVTEFFEHVKKYFSGGCGAGATV